MDYKEIVTKAASIYNDRQNNYGDMDEMMERLCLIYQTITGQPMTPYHGHMFLHCLKLVRIKPDPKNGENYWDGVNYLAFAGSAAQIKDNIPVPPVAPAPAQTVPGSVNVTSGTVTMTVTEDLEQDIQELVKKFPLEPNGGNS